VINVPLDEIEHSPFQHREEESDDSESIQGLAASITAVGIIQPLIVRRPDGASVRAYQLICGHRRLQAAKLAGLDYVPCVVRQPKNDIAQLSNVIENLQRKDLSPMDEAEGVQELTHTMKLAAPEIAKMLGVSERWVFRRRKLAQIVPEWRKIIREKKGGQEFCEALAAITPHLQRILLKLPVTETLEKKDIGSSLWDAGARDRDRMAWAVKHPEWCKNCKKTLNAEDVEIPQGYWQLRGCTLCGDPECLRGKERNFVDEVQAQLKLKKCKPVLVKEVTAIPNIPNSGMFNMRSETHTVPYVITEGHNAGNVYWIDPHAAEKRADKEAKKSVAIVNSEPAKKTEEEARLEAINILLKEKGQPVICIRRALELAYVYFIGADDDDSRGELLLKALNMPSEDLAKIVAEAIREHYIFIDDDSTEADQIATTYGLKESDIKATAKEILGNG
jgi:ParB/RepB/Spo0J family partition protein